MTCHCPSQNYSMILSSFPHSSGVNAPFRWKCLAQSYFVTLAQSCLRIPPVCPTVPEYGSFIFRKQNLTQVSLQLLLPTCLSFQCLLFTSIFLFPETYCSNIRTSCHHFCESSFVPQLSFFTLPLTSINSFCCFHHVFPLMDRHSFLLSELASAFHSLKDDRRCSPYAPLISSPMVSFSTLKLPRSCVVLCSLSPVGGSSVARGEERRWKEM